MSEPGPRFHPISHGFRWKTRRGPLRRLTPRQRDSFNALGYLHIQAAFAPREIATVTAAIDPLEAACEQRLHRVGGRLGIAAADVITFTRHLAPRSLALRAFAAHRFIKDLCHDLLGDEVRLYDDRAVYKKTDKIREFPWHQDIAYGFIEPQQYLTFWVPLVDVDEESGCLWIAPGLHRQGALDHWTTDVGLKCLDRVDDAVPRRARAGDAIVHSSLAPHRSGPNQRKGTVRKAYVLQYCRDGAVALGPDGQRESVADPVRNFKILGAGA